MELSDLLFSLLIILIFFQLSSSSKILVISGYLNTNNKDDIVKTEAIDLEDATNTCQNLPDFPIKIHGATAGLIEVLGTVFEDLQKCLKPKIISILIFFLMFEFSRQKEQKFH